MDNLKLDCTLAYLNEGIIINEFDMLVESVNNEISNFSNITESLEIVNEGKVIDAIITFISLFPAPMLSVERSRRNLLRKILLSLRFFALILIQMSMLLLMQMFSSTILLINVQI